MSDTGTLAIEQWMTGYTLDEYDYDAPKMKIIIPRLMSDKSGNIKPTKIGVDQNIFKSKANIKPASTASNNSYFEVKVGIQFKATYKSLEYDDKAKFPSPQFPKGTLVRIFIPDKDLTQAIIIPLT